MDQYQIPLVTEIVDRVGNSQYLSKLDLCKGFLQVPLTEEACRKTAIVTSYGKYEYTRMPFGLVNATSTFQRLMDVVLLGLNDVSAAYIDDILIFSSSWEDHLIHIEQVLEQLQKAGLTARPEKCEWGKSQLVYLGHLIGCGRVAIPEDRASAMLHYVRPTNKKGVKAFLGTTGYYRRFVQNYGSVATSLTRLIRKSEPEQICWTDQCEQAFSSLCKSVARACVLTIPNASDSYRLQTDASGLGIGAVLSVIREEEMPVAYYSRQLRSSEKNYSSTELECLAVVAAIKHFECYLAG